MFWFVVGWIQSLSVKTSLSWSRRVKMSRQHWLTISACETENVEERTTQEAGIALSFTRNSNTGTNSLLSLRNYVFNLKLQVLEEVETHRFDHGSPVEFEEP